MWLLSAVVMRPRDFLLHAAGGEHTCGKSDCEDAVGLDDRLEGLEGGLGRHLGVQCYGR